MTNHTQIATELKPLANRYRMQIVSLLLTGDKNVGELNEEVHLSQPALSQHLCTLRRANVVTFRRDRRQIYYSLVNPTKITSIVQAVEAA